MHAEITANNIRKSCPKGCPIVNKFSTRLVSLRTVSYDQCRINLYIFNACNTSISQKKTHPLTGEVGTDGSVMSVFNHQ